MLNACVARFDVIEKLKSFWFLGELNKISFRFRPCSHSVFFNLFACFSGCIFLLYIRSEACMLEDTFLNKIQIWLGFHLNYVN